MYKSKETNTTRTAFYAFCTLLSAVSLYSCRSHSVAVTPLEKDTRSIVVLYENDVHCAIDGYAKLAGLRDAIADTAYTQVVSCGDFIQGSTIGALSKGQYVIDVMKTVGYDAVTLGNHEFDFKMPRQLELLKDLGVPVVCANLVDVREYKPLYADYLISEVGGKRIAYVGVVTPSAYNSMPTAFRDVDGAPLYELNRDSVCTYVQRAVDKAHEAGADYVIVLSHLGENKRELRDVTSHDLAAHTRGIDVILDGHSHSVVPQKVVQNLDGRDVPITQTGTQFANFGKLVIMPDGKMDISLIDDKKLVANNAQVQATIDSIKQEVAVVTQRVIGKSDVALQLKDKHGIQLTRVWESNAGDLVTDAFRTIAGTDVAMVNAGSIRNSLDAGDLTYGDLVSLLPYDNMLCETEVTGQQIMDVLKLNTANLPRPDGQFPAVSGMHYTVDIDTHEVSNVEVLNSKTGQYEPINLEQTYTLASTDYAIYNGGFRNALANAKVTRDAFIGYCDALIEYFVNHLHSHITTEYEKPQGRITLLGFEKALQEYERNTKK